MRALLPAFTAGLLAAAVMAPAPAQATDVSVLAGGSITSGGRWTTTAFANVSGTTYEWKHLELQPVGTLGWIKGRDTPHDNLDHNIYVAGAGVRLPHLWRNAFFSFQVGVAGGRTDAISSSEQFISSLGWQGEHWVFMVRHISNGHFFGGKNLGETMALVGVTF